MLIMLVAVMTTCQVTQLSCSCQGYQIDVVAVALESSQAVSCVSRNDKFRRPSVSPSLGGRENGPTGRPSVSSSREGPRYKL